MAQIGKGKVNNVEVALVTQGARINPAAFGRGYQHPENDCIMMP